jgi:ABC-type antimicrobial peptide transport system permease subunit
MMEYVENINEQMRMIQMVMGLVGAVALFVAAINIANTMIMSIYERTKEIGIMKVIGCRLGDICSLFLLEAGILGLIGGIIGIGLSFAGSTALNNMPPSESGSNIFGVYIDPNVGGSLSIIPFWLVLLALAVSVGIAVLAGLYPSIRAMRLSALEAIRNE